MFSRCLIAVVLSGLLLLSTVRAGSSNSLMDVSPDGNYLLVANPDNGSVTVVDVKSSKAVREISMGGKTEGVSWIGQGPLAAATVYTSSRLIFFNTLTGQIVQERKVAAEPYGVVCSRDGSRLWITHEYPGLVSEVDAHDQKIIREIKVGSFLRGLALNANEEQLYVTEFYSAALLALDLKSGKVIDRWPGHSTDNLCRHVCVHPRLLKAYLTHLRSKNEIINGRGSIFPQLSICDLQPSPDKRRTSMALDTYNNVYVVANPWESALSPDGKRLYTVYAGTNDMNVSDIVEDNYREIERVGYAIRVGKNPRAVRVSPDNRSVFVYNALNFSVEVYQADSMQRTVTIKVCASPKSPEWVRGKILFNSALPPMSSPRWVSCSSCHPDGHSDGRVWQNPEGLRRTPAFFGLAHTHPLHWSADRDEVQDFEFTIRSRLMQGTGLLRGFLEAKKGFAARELEEHLAGRSDDLDALAVYCNSFDPPLSPHIPAEGKLSPAAEHGKRLFFSKEVGCASCHSGPYYTDSSLTKPFKLHDVGTAEPTEKIGPRYDTPTLLGIYRNTSFLHHGQAASLHEVLTVCNRQDKHGHTSQLNLGEIDDLVAFLKSLPYETPPSETPNTVKHRYRSPGKEPWESNRALSQSKR